MPRDTRASFLRELQRVSPSIRAAFEEAIQDIRSSAQRRAIEAAIQRAVETGNIQRGVNEVLAALQLGAEFWAPLDAQITQAFMAGGVYQLTMMPKKPILNAGPLQVRFQGRHSRAEAWTRQRAGALITEITEQTRTLIRETITEAVEKSHSYRSVTRALIGEVQGNQLKGGLIGLHSSQARAVRRARDELMAGNFTAYLRRGRRDLSFELTGRIIDRAKREGRGLTLTEAETVTRRYADRLLRLRGETIARTEGNRAMNEGRAEAIRQMIETGKIPAHAVSLIWDATPGKRTRDSHRALNGKTIKWGEVFVSPVTGARLRWPHDERARASETVNCRCSCRFRINWRAVADWREMDLAA